METPRSDTFRLESPRTVAAVPVPDWYNAPAPASPRRFEPLPMPDLTYTDEVEAAVGHLYEKMSHAIPRIEWPVHAPYIKAINELKKVRGAAILAHNYQTPEIFHGVADIVGDSLQLAREATRVEDDVIIQCGVHFMAETSKLLNPQKTVLIPDMKAGCSLASSITGADVRALKSAYPGVPVVAYVNTSADVKAEVDICCTSSNAVQVVESLGVKKVVFLPDQYLARWVASQTDIEIVAWRGACEVHERFTGEELRAYRESDPSIKIIAHPECPPDVIEEADYTGSTAGIIDWCVKHKEGRVLMVTECSMADNVVASAPDIEFVKPCNLCPHMKRITLPKILDTLLTMEGEVLIAPEMAKRARSSVEAMVSLLTN
ncbi:MAG: quinolinate synthase NadA [Pseudomonadota bacterium]